MAIPAPPASPVVAAAVRPAAPWHQALALALAVDAGTLPNTSPGVALEGNLQRGALRLILLVSGFESQDLVRSSDVGGKFQLALGGALACFAPRRGRWTPLACAGVELGRLAGTGLQVARPETGSTFWRAGRAEGGATVALGGSSALLLRAGLAVPLTRPEFVLNGSQFVYQPSRVAARITTGFEVGF